MDFPREQVLAAYQNAPASVREAFNSPDTVDVIEGIQNAHKLHVDTAGLIGRYVGYMLVGLVEPAAFYERLLGLGMSADTANAIIREINEKVFQPLQKRMREGGEAPRGPVPAAPAPSDSAHAEPFAAVPPEPARAPIPAPAPREVAPPPAITFSVNRLEQAPSPQTSPVQEPPRATPPPVQRQAAPQVAPTELPPRTPVYEQAAPGPLPHSRTMASDMELVQHGYDALRVPGVPHAPGPSLATPARSFQTASVPVTRTALVTPQPVALPEPFTAPVPPPPPPVRPAAATTAPVRLTPVDRTYGDAPITKEYGSDPYREPISG